MLTTAKWCVQGGLTVHPTERFKIDTQADQAVLICKRAEKSDAGKYSVTLQNDKGQDSTSINVIVFGTSHSHRSVAFPHARCKAMGVGTKVVMVKKGIIFLFFIFLPGNVSFVLL